MGGLNPEISDGIRMFKPKSLKEAISLARMRAYQLLRQHKFSQSVPVSRTPMVLPTPTRSPSISPVKHLTWDKMQKRLAQGLCFNCPEKFTAGHKCKGPQLLLLEGSTNVGDIVCEEIMNESARGAFPIEHNEPEFCGGKLGEVVSSSNRKSYIGGHGRAAESVQKCGP